MVLVDTIVWIDFFADKDTSQVVKLTRLLEENFEVAICGVIFTEILQGIRNQKEYQQILHLLNSFIFLEMTKDTFEHAAEIYRSLRQRGFTIRKTIDCLIAAVAIQNNIPLLHHDRDFELMEKYCGLSVL